MTSHSDSTGAAYNSLYISLIHATDAHYGSTLVFEKFFKNMFQNFTEKKPGKKSFF